MADSPPYRDPRQETGGRPSTPRWVKLFGIVVIVLALLFVISLLAGVQHGPGLHTPSSSAGGRTLPSSEQRKTARVGDLADTSTAGS
ncbi:MAG TPA: hypothetical protein VFO07_20300 [Roseiflexaceae bacterium]|nr:hypothetical protein [Roseiflexaceae bacterium]